MAECHSAFKRQVGDQFDTVDATRRTIVANGLVHPEDKDDPSQAFLIRTLTVGVDSILDPGSGQKIRMPYVSPMPDADIDLIERWIAAGAPGAQCVPNGQNRGCQAILAPGAQIPEYRVVECVDGNIGATVEVCTGIQICTYNRMNGQCVTP